MEMVPLSLNCKLKFLPSSPSRALLCRKRVSRGVPLPVRGMLTQVGCFVLFLAGLVFLGGGLFLCFVEICFRGFFFGVFCAPRFLIEVQMPLTVISNSCASTAATPAMPTL